MGKHPGTIVLVNTGQVVPKEHIGAIVKAYPSVWGMAMQHEGRLMLEKKSQKDYPSVDDITEIIEKTKDEGYRVMFFGRFDDYEDEEDIPPFLIRTTEGAEYVAMFGEGDFDEFEGLDGKHTGLHSAVSNNLFPRMEKIYDEDIAKFQAALTSDANKKLFSMTYKERGWFTFLPVKEKPFSFGNNKTMRGMAWGTISNSEGIDIPEPKEEPKAAPTEAPKAGGIFDMLSGKKADKAAPAAAPAPTVLKEEWIKVSPPPQLEDSARNAWIRAFYGKKAIGLVGGDGELPANHKQKKDFEFLCHASLLPFVKEGVNKQEDVKALQARLRKHAAAHPVDFREADARLEGENLSRSSVRENYILGFSDAEKSEMLEVALSFLDNKSGPRPSPIELQKQEENLPSFPEVIGVKEEVLYGWSTADWAKFTGSKKAGNIIRYFVKELIKAKGVKLADLTGTEKPVPLQPDQPAQPAAAPAAAPGPAPAQKGGIFDLFPKKKAG